MTKEQYISAINQDYSKYQNAKSNYETNKTESTNWHAKMTQAQKDGNTAAYEEAKDKCKYYDDLLARWNSALMQILDRMQNNSNQLKAQYGYTYEPWNGIDNPPSDSQEPPKDENNTPSENSNPTAPSVPETPSNPVDVISGTTASANAPASSQGNSSSDATDDPGVQQKDIVRDSEEEEGAGAGLDYNTVKNKGVVFPIIRINDHYFTSEEIRDFYIETGYYKDYHEYQSKKFPMTGFVPTMHLVINTTSPDLLKNNQIKSGDKASIFFSNGGGMIKSYRGDYIINSVVTSDKPSEITDTPITYIIDGELFIPNLRNEAEKFNFNGSARDAMMDCANRLGLGFYFCDPDDTDDYQGWVCSKNLLEYALDVSSHAWKEFNSFFDAWIDPRYGLSFINMNKMLIVDGLDEALDFTPFVNTVNKSVGIDGKKATESEEEKRVHSQPQAKMITNIPRDDESVTPFFIKKWNIVNRASEIAKEIGINQQQSLNIDNPGVETENADVDMNYSIPINNTKLQNGFFVLIGPGVNLTYTQADQIDPNQSFVKNSYKVGGGAITEVMSNDDSDMMKSTGGNMYSSGNTNRFYDAGWEHNMRNNLQLQKQFLEVELGGLNLGIMRGEKIPAIIMDNDKIQSSARVGNFTGSTVQNALYEMASGWYVIDGLMWHWSSIDNENSQTLWDTKLKLVRREWPIPGRAAVIGTDNQETVFQTTVDASENNNSSSSNPSGTSLDGLAQASNYSADGGSLESNRTNDTTLNRANGGANGSGNSIIGSSAKSALNVAEEDKTTAEEVPLTGLKSDLKDIYYLIKNLCPKIKLVSARRWAVDENGNRTEGNAYVTRNGMYKCVNAKGEIMYFKSNNSKHLYGEAFDIINGSGQDFNEIMTKYIMLDNNLLKSMAMAGVAACVEQTTDDSGAATKHYHIGTEKNILKNFWDSVKAINTNMDATTINTINNYIGWNARKTSAEIKHSDVNEDNY